MRSPDCSLPVIEHPAFEHADGAGRPREQDRSEHEPGQVAFPELLSGHIQAAIDLPPSPEARRLAEESGLSMTRLNFPARLLKDPAHPAAYVCWEADQLVIVTNVRVAEKRIVRRLAGIVAGQTLGGEVARTLSSATPVVPGNAAVPAAAGGRLYVDEAFLRDLRKRTDRAGRAP